MLDAACRIGEALGLTWADLNFDSGRISIRRTLVGVDKGGTRRFGIPKTAKGSRSVTLMPATLAALRAARARQTEERLKLGPDWPGL